METKKIVPFQVCFDLRDVNYTKIHDQHPAVIAPNQEIQKLIRCEYIGILADILDDFVATVSNLMLMVTLIDPEHWLVKLDAEPVTLWSMNADKPPMNVKGLLSLSWVDVRDPDTLAKFMESARNMLQTLDIPLDKMQLL